MNDNIIDLPEFLERVQDDKDLLLELLDIYTEDFKIKRGQLVAAINNKDYEQIRQIAHSLKGASGNISAKPLRVIFLALEELGRKNSTDGAAALLANMEGEYDRLQGRIVLLKKELKG